MDSGIQQTSTHIPDLPLIRSVTLGELLNLYPSVSWVIKWGITQPVLQGCC